ncbi:uncharacterized protein LOC125780316 [Bactrocera dorsalis]|uniref:Uncharacterized protein LOC125780316 n=1 Tax=Bactrocera dorsalis TaxID=27457 RepID=A0ABM3K9Y3_BACDO|nr:uncharacterized protein LOC125780316 [Bactrocera dorsalis]
MAHKYTPKGVHVKIRNLTQIYREEKKKFGSSGEPMSSEPVCTPVMTLTNSLSVPPLSSSISAASTPKKRNHMDELIKVAKEQNELLEKVVEDGKILTERVVNAIEQSTNTKEFIGIMKNILEKM